MKNNNLLLLIFLCIVMMTGCASSPRDEENNILSTLTKEQQFTLLSMLKTYDSHQAAVKEWNASQPSIAQLVVLENDLRLLIEQLSELATKAEEATSEAQLSNSASKPKASIINNDASGSDTQSEPIVIAQDSEFKFDPDFKGFTLQLTAVNSLSSLENYWQQIHRTHRVLFAEIMPFYERIEERNGGYLFRLKAGKFASSDEAMDLCRRFAALDGSCFVTDNLAGAPLYQ